MDAVPKTKDGLIDWSQVSQIHFQTLFKLLVNSNLVILLGFLILGCNVHGNPLKEPCLNFESSGILYIESYIKVEMIFWCSRLSVFLSKIVTSVTIFLGK